MKKITAILTLAMAGSLFGGEPASQPSIPVSQAKPAMSEDAILLAKIVERNKKNAASQPAESKMEIKSLINIVLQQLLNLKSDKNKTAVQNEEDFYSIVSTLGEKYAWKKVYFNLDIVDIGYSDNPDLGNNAYIITFDFQIKGIINSKNNNLVQVNKALIAFLDFDEAKKINKNIKISVTGEARVSDIKPDYAFYFVCNNNTFSRHIYIEIANPVFKINDKEIKTNFTVENKKEE